MPAGTIAAGHDARDRRTNPLERLATHSEYGSRGLTSALAIDIHAESIFRKVGATCRADAVAKGLREGLVHL